MTSRSMIQYYMNVVHRQLPVPRVHPLCEADPWESPLCAACRARARALALPLRRTSRVRASASRCCSREGGPTCVEPPAPREVVGEPPLTGGGGGGRFTRGADASTTRFT
eukprot:scaffold24913_cov73-Phaeocystis_antarctica.AAC.1